MRHGWGFVDWTVNDPQHVWLRRPVRGAWLSTGKIKQCSYNYRARIDVSVLHLCVHDENSIKKNNAMTFCWWHCNHKQCYFHGLYMLPHVILACFGSRRINSSLHHWRTCRYIVSLWCLSTSRRVYFSTRSWD